MGLRCTEFEMKKGLKDQKIIHRGMHIAYQRPTCMARPKRKNECRKASNIPRYRNMECVDDGLGSTWSIFSGMIPDIYGSFERICSLRFDDKLWDFERLGMPTNISFPEELGVPKFDGWPGVWPMCFPSANFFGIAFGVLLWHILAINVAMKMWPEIWGTWPIFHIFVTVPRNEAGLSCYRPMIHWPMMRRGFWCLFLSSITSWIFQWYILIWLGDETWWNIHNYKLFWCSPKRDHFHSCPSYCSYCSCFISKMWWLWWRVKKRYLGFGGTHFG